MRRVLQTEALIEELEDFARCQKHALKNNLVKLLIHLLKYKYQSERRSSSWLASIAEHRRRIQFALEDSPSLKPYLEDVFSDCYSMARVDAAFETNLPLSMFPEDAPSLDTRFLNEKVLRSGWLPE